MLRGVLDFWPSADAGREDISYYDALTHRVSGDE